MGHYRRHDQQEPHDDSGRHHSHSHHQLLFFIAISSSVLLAVISPHPHFYHHCQLRLISPLVATASDLSDGSAAAELKVCCIGMRRNSVEGAEESIIIIIIGILLFPFRKRRKEERKEKYLDPTCLSFLDTAAAATADSAVAAPVTDVATYSIIDFHEGGKKEGKGEWS